MLRNKELNPIVTALFITSTKLNVSLVSVTQSFFALPKIARLNFHTILL